MGWIIINLLRESKVSPIKTVVMLLSNIGYPKLGRVPICCTDDGYAILQNANVHLADKKRKEIINEFNKICLKITIQVSFKTVNFLEVSFDMDNETYNPYHKPNESPKFINSNSYHPKNNVALQASSYDERLSFIPKNNSNVPNRRKNRNRKTIWC